IKSFFNKSNRIKILTIIGIVGIILIMFSECSFFKKKDNDNIKTETENVSDINDYATALESKIKNVAQSIEGAGQCEVFITLEKGVETVYAQTQKTNTDYQTNYNSGEEQKIQGKDNTERNYILVEDEKGNKTALVKTVLEPTVKGAVIVCDGANNPQIEQKITECVATALGISWEKVSVCKRKI
ncbi:MAG: hypothetical protein RR640_05940, partial [Oscillospiraceae bacterium]